MKFETKAIHTGEEPNLSGSGDVVSPIHLATTFAREKVGEPTAGYEYSRQQNPTRKALETRLAALESAQYGLAYSSGMAAQTSLILCLLKAGDHVVAFDDLYGGTRRLFNNIFHKHYNIEFTYTDASVTENIEKAIQKNTRLIWLESPTNPLMKLCDIKAICKIAKQHNILTLVDNTFMTPFFQNPLNLGADLVMHSTSKYINGHADSVGGAIMLNDKSIQELLELNQYSVGGILSPFDSYLVLRGSKTLALRMKRHEENALKISEHLENHKKVKHVFYPGLKSHPQHELAKIQATGFGGMIAFELSTDLNGSEKFVESLKYFHLAESLGGVESLIELPAAMTHASVPPEERVKLGITDGLVRLSVGIENVDDLLEDLDRALNET